MRPNIPEEFKKIIINGEYIVIGKFSFIIDALQ